MIFKKPTLFEKDFELITDLYPKLRYHRNDQQKCWIISGELDICDQTGNYWDTFHILIAVSARYPEGVPKVFEKSHIIPRSMEWHISEAGECCLDITHNLELASRRGMRLAAFMEKEVYPYFANQLYRLSKQKYAGEEYGHLFEGVIQYYREQLHITEPAIAASFIKAVLEKNIPGRNQSCLCGSGKKTKNCHLHAFDILTELEKTTILHDLLSFEKQLCGP